KDVWHLKADRGQVQSNGDDVRLSGNVTVTGPAPGSDLPLSLTTDHIRVNTPTEFIETDAPVKLTWSGNELDAVGMEADLKAGNLRLKSSVHGSSAKKTTGFRPRRRVGRGVVRCARRFTGAAREPADRHRRRLDPGQP